MPMGDPTANPSNLSMHNNHVQQQPTHVQPVTMDMTNGMQTQHLQQIQPAPPGQLAVTANTIDKVLKPKPKTTSKTSGSASSSDDDLEIEDEEPEMRPALITLAKPDGYKDKLLWEAVDSVWTPRNKPASSEKIVAAIKFIGEAVRGLREQWKSHNERLKKAELPNSETSSDAPQLKQLVGQLREIMETLAARVTNWGHPSILKRYVFSQQPLLVHTHHIRIPHATPESCHTLLHSSPMSLAALPFGALLQLMPHDGSACLTGCLTIASTAACVHSSIPYHAVPCTIKFITFANCFLDWGRTSFYCQPYTASCLIGSMQKTTIVPLSQAFSSWERNYRQLMRKSSRR